VILGGKYTALTEVIRHVTLTEEYSCLLKSRSSVNLWSSNVCTKVCMDIFNYIRQFSTVYGDVVNMHVQ